MRKLHDTIVRLARQPRGFPPARAASSRLRPFDRFGPNPGGLRAWLHVPDNVAPGMPLVVVLHGCTQDAAGYDQSSGWSRLADQHGFVLLYPEQQRANNPNLCFNWYSPEHAARGLGEARSIRDMVAAVQQLHRTDPARVFVSGLSAGGAMTAVMLATYPEVFASGAVIAGLPFGIARSVPEAFDRMRGHGGPGRAALADIVRAASNHEGTWPTLSVWHGSNDHTVDPSNASALVEQWRTLHGTPGAPSMIDRVDGHAHRVWTDPAGREVVEEYSIAGLGHGTPLDTAGSGHGERAAPHMLDAGISSTYLIARFWGIVPPQARVRTTSAAASPKERRHTGGTSRPTPWSGQSGIGKTIEVALRSAGLMK